MLGKLTGPSENGVFKIKRQHVAFKAKRISDNQAKRHLSLGKQMRIMEIRVHLPMV